MTRVTENSSINSIQHSINKTKTKLEDLQLKGTSLKRIIKPSDDPVGNIEVLLLRSQLRNNDQYLKNAVFARMKLELTENALEGLVEILMKAKEIAITQSSDFYGGEIRKNISQEIENLKRQLLSIANQRVGNRYLFSGQKTSTQPFNSSGKYFGDDHYVEVEVAKDFYLPTNIPGSFIFYHIPESETNNIENIQKGMEGNNDPSKLIPIQDKIDKLRENVKEDGLFIQLQSFENALKTNDSNQIQNLLERLDNSIEKVVKLRTLIGVWMNSLDNAVEKVQKHKFINEKQKSVFEDADITKLFSDLNKQENLLKASYKISAGLLNKSLLEHLK